MIYPQKIDYKVGMISLGCPKNLTDAEIMLNRLAEAGFEIVEKIEDSDVMIINTCGFIESAKMEAIETILEVAEYKKAHLIKGIVVTGCLAERYKDEIKKEIPEVDAVIGIGSNAAIVKVCQKAALGYETLSFPSKNFLCIDDERQLLTPSHWAYLKIAEGCSNCCSYCAIPLIRGKFRSRTIESIVSEAESLAKRGVKEVILVAQDTTRYGKDIYGKYSLDVLLNELVKVEGIEWIRLYYCYPERITDSLIDVIAKEEKICSYIDIPLQHADKDVLKAMNRRGNAEAYKELIEKMRGRIEGLSLRTTFMVGFPSETEEQFDNLCRFVKEIEFDKMGCFEFSPEEDTIAFNMDDQIDDEVKRHRAELLTDIQYSITEKINSRRIGNVYKVIVDEFDGNKYTGRSYLDSPEIDSGIIFTSKNKINIGDFVNVKITGFDGYDLTGEEYELT